MKFYNTTAKDVEAACVKFAITSRMSVALLERGNTHDDITKMTPDQKMVELTAWHGGSLHWRDVISEAIAVGLVRPNGD